MTRKSARTDELLRRRENVARLRLRGLSIREICSALARLTPEMGGPIMAKGPDGVPVLVGSTVVHRDLKALREEWRRSAAEDIAERKAKQLAEIDEAKRRAWTDGDLQALARFIKLESDIFGTMAPVKMTEVPWREEAKKYGLDPEQSVSTFEQALTGKLVAHDDE